MLVKKKKTIRQQLKTEPRSVLTGKWINYCSSNQTEHEVNDFTQTSKTEHMSYMSQEAVLTSMSTLGIQPLIVLQHKPDTTSHKLSTQRIGDMLCQNSQFHMIKIVHSKVQDTWCTHIHNILHQTNCSLKVQETWCTHIHKIYDIMHTIHSRYKRQDVLTFTMWITSHKLLT